MRCPICNRRCECLDSRPLPANMRKRRYACTQGHRFTTVEQVVFGTVDHVKPKPGGTGRKLLERSTT